MAAIDTANNLAVYDSLGLTPKVDEKRDQGQLGLDQFLKLMTTQLQNQDPLEPMDNGDFLGQIAQFGAVSGIEQLNTSFDGFSNSITSGQALQAGTLIGRNVLAPVSGGWLDAGGSISGRVELPASASNVRVEISDQSGQLLRTLNLGAQPSGPLEFNWDGVTDAGDYAAPGVYNVSVQSLRGGNNEVLQTQLYSRVDSVTLGSGANGLTLNLAGLGNIPFNQVTAIQ